MTLADAYYLRHRDELEGYLEDREQEGRLRTTVLKAVRVTPLYRACLRFELGP